MLWELFVHNCVSNIAEKLSKASIARDRKLYDAEVVGQKIVPYRSSEWDNFPEDWYLQQEAKARANSDYDRHVIQPFKTGE